MRKYSEHNMMVGKSVGRLTISVATGSVGMEMSISTAILQ